MRQGHICIVYDRDPEPGQWRARKGAKTAANVDELTPARVPWPPFLRC